MDLRTITIISTFLLMTAEADQAAAGPDHNVTSTTAQTTSTNKNCSCPADAPAATLAPTFTPSSSALALGFLTVRWTNECDGGVHLTIYHHSSAAVCHTSKENASNILGNVCQTKTGCEGKPVWREGKTPLEGYRITESGAELQTSCKTLRVKCKVLPDSKGQLQAYKVVTALLCCVLLILFLIRFTRPTVKVLQKRLSDRRQNRWIGPTQSHSVSYHRGKAAVKNNDREKRLSYPALERLAVSDSREPSSNRNSDCNF